MRRPDRAFLVMFAGALLLAACSKSPTLKSPKIRGSEQIAPTYRFEDDAATRRRVEVREMLGIAAQRLSIGDLAEAEKQARGALRRDPAAADGHTLLAVIADRRGDSEQAGAHYRQAAELGPSRGDLLNNYGAWLCGNGYPAEALVWFDRALAMPDYPSPASALANAGGCAVRSGQHERAERDLRRALELDPGNAYALASMAELSYGAGQLMQARAFAQRRLAAAPADASVLQLAVKIEQGLGDRVAASRYHQRLREEFPQAVLVKSGEDPG
ncbi:type IV pilus biogenesis/stability protein PilW [Xanthomonas sp. XNM01]|uniref:type IV pilus biogenesis/stability protein PilW n=1 Tax=Xanthomonas sp. XNM01 TaxID=2769289 RepID=UPI00178596DD|nr:type IV pilus biogenesis/stability protein PilW [Xanthomonas sp. XNM01]MBD9368147.1 type IV pilus biogenesis/stability protein PilW [Xanthomonas sp. XNM01]